MNIKIFICMLLCVGFIVFFQASTAHGGSGRVLSAWASVTPTIDGVLSSGEWNDADSLPCTTTGGVDCIVYVKNDAGNMYFAVMTKDSTLSQDTKGTDSVWLYFDNDHDGLGPEDGDDIVGWVGYQSEGFRDGYSAGTYVWSRDIDDRGTSDGSAVATGDGTYNYFEISHPLDSRDDAHDFSLSFGDTVGFGIRISIDGFDRGWWPSSIPSDWLNIEVAARAQTYPFKIYSFPSGVS